jgi:hypothetical protein
LRNGDEYEEFQLPYPNVQATISDDVVSRIKLYIASDTRCTAIVVFGDDNRIIVVSLRRGSYVIVRGADRWRCSTLGNTGENCSADHPFELFAPDLVAACLNTIVSELGSDESGNFMKDLTLPSFPGLFDIPNVLNVVTSILIVIAVLAYLAIIVISVRVVKNKQKKGRNDEFVEA